MKVDLELRGLAFAGIEVGGLPADRRVELPEPRFRGRKARLPGLAVELARRALGEGEVGAEGSVLVGTALGCLTETAAFVENLFEQDGAAPKPRAFTASVHNAIASEVARKLGARGECQTFVQGESSLAAALFAAERARVRGLTGDWLVGALDEWTPYVARGRAACGDEGTPAEGGAFFHLARPGSGAGQCPRLTELAIGRPRDARDWCSRREPVDMIYGLGAASDGGAFTGSSGAASFRSLREVFGDSPAAPALGLALAAADCGEPGPRRIALVAASRLGEWSWITVEAPRS